MATIRSFTSLEQSRKLAEFLPLESADMEYMFLKKDNSMVSEVPFIKLGYEEPDCPYNMVPCWSLTALFRLLPHSAQLERGHATELCRVILPIEFIDSDWCINPVDACYEVILKLYEDGYYGDQET